jgi:hypothetical protein
LTADSHPLKPTSDHARINNKVTRLKPLPKSGAIAAILNFFIWGLGYLYLGKKTTFGVILVLGNIITLFSLAYPFGAPTGGYLLFQTLGILVVGIAFAWDASLIAKEP